MRRRILGLMCFALLGLTFALGETDRRDLRHDRVDRRHDRHDLRGDRRNLRRDLRGGHYRDAKRDREDIGGTSVI